MAKRVMKLAQQAWELDMGLTLAAPADSWGLDEAWDSAEDAMESAAVAVCDLADVLADKAGIERKNPENVKEGAPPPADPESMARFAVGLRRRAELLRNDLLITAPQHYLGLSYRVGGRDPWHLRSAWRHAVDAMAAAHLALERLADTLSERASLSVENRPGDTAEPGDPRVDVKTGD